jgi:hypothetical protein
MTELKDKLKEKTPFRVPDGYFDNLTDRIIDNVEQEEKKEKIRMLPVMKSFLWMAASFLFIFTLGKLIIPHFADPSQKLSGDVVAQNGVVDTAKEESVFDFTGNFEPSVDEIIEYLSEEGIDGELLVAEL